MKLKDGFNCDRARSTFVGPYPRDGWRVTMEIELKDQGPSVHLFAGKEVFGFYTTVAGTKELIAFFRSAADWLESSGMGDGVEPDGVPGEIVKFDTAITIKGK